MSAFYRYLRPLKFDPLRFEMTTVAKGGICFRFERRGGGLLFTHSRCHPEDVFSRAVARSIADTRAKDAYSDARLVEMMTIPNISEALPDLLPHILRECRAFSPTGLSPIIHRYISVEWQGLADQVEKLLARNWREQEMADVWIAASRAMKTAERYEALGDDTANDTSF
jgi:hypothetical protein